MTRIGLHVCTSAYFVLGPCEVQMHSAMTPVRDVSRCVAMASQFMFLGSCRHAWDPLPTESRLCAVCAGLSQPLPDDQANIQADSQVGTVPYTAPETFATDRVSKATDVYAFGILRAPPPCWKPRVVLACWHSAACPATSVASILVCSDSDLADTL